MNNPERPIPEAGQYYMHFKGKMCLVINIATHSETGEKLVIYMCLGDTESHRAGIYARPHDMFMSKTDKEKYPEASQEYRFERVKLEDLMQERSNVKILIDRVVS